MEKLKWKRARVLSRYFQSMRKQISRCAYNTRCYNSESVDRHLGLELGPIVNY